MTHYQVEIAARAEKQVRGIDAEWRENRPAAPELFTNELAGAIERLQHMPFSGHLYAIPRPKGVRRIVLRRSRYHVYYTVDDKQQVVTIRAVWHGSRGRGPSLR